MSSGHYVHAVLGLVPPQFFMARLFIVPAFHIVSPFLKRPAPLATSFEVFMVRGFDNRSASVGAFGMQHRLGFQPRSLPNKARHFLEPRGSAPQLEINLAASK